MREILFRGKRTDNGEWVYGDLVHSWIQTRKDNGKRITEIKWQSVDIHGETWNEHEEVIPSTIGQYTGLTDKNGTKIFEGDKVVVESYSYTEPEDEACGEVIITIFGNALRTKKENGKEDCICFSELQGSYITIYEVMGNIHDNPELAEVEK